VEAGREMLLTFLAAGIAALPFTFYEFQTGQALLTRQRVKTFDSVVYLPGCLQFG
jgi:hypothetical protein